MLFATPRSDHAPHQVAPWRLGNLLRHGRLHLPICRRLLISAFRATLEEVRAADVIVHVRDISHADSEAQTQDVEAVLGEIGVANGGDRRDEAAGTRWIC